MSERAHYAVERAKALIVACFASVLVVIATFGIFAVGSLTGFVTYTVSMSLAAFLLFLGYAKGYDGRCKYVYENWLGQSMDHPPLEVWKRSLERRGMFENGVKELDYNTSEVRYND